MNWRYAFWVEAIFMLPFAVFGFVMKPLQLKGTSFGMHHSICVCVFNINLVMVLSLYPQAFLLLNQKHHQHLLKLLRL